MIETDYVFGYVKTTCVFYAILIIYFIIVNKTRQETLNENTFGIYFVFDNQVDLSIANDNDTETKNSVRLTVFVIFLCGSPFLYVYKSFLTSALAVPSIYKPFTSPEEILYTSYR